MILRKALLVILITTAYTCFTSEISMNAVVYTVRHNLMAFDYNENEASGTNEYSRFLTFYGLRFKNTRIKSGYIKHKSYRIAVYNFIPDNPIGTTFLIHGYYDHVGIQRNLIEFLLENNYEVITFDLPGHGLSDGKRADIDNFDTYTDIVKQVIKTTEYQDSRPNYLIGHSTGAAAIINGLLQDNFKEISGIVLVSPLIHSSYWNSSKIGVKIAGLFTKEISRKFRNNSSNTEYLNFVQNKDVLQYKKFPLNWFKVLVEWNNKINKLSPSSHEILVIQGTSDSTVDWQYNLDFITKKFPKSDIIKINNAEHQLFNERLEIRDNVFSEITKYLKKNNNRMEN